MAAQRAVKAGPHARAAGGPWPSRTQLSVAAGGRHQRQGQHGGHARARCLQRRGLAHRALHLAAPGQLARAHVHRRRSPSRRMRSWRWPSRSAAPSTASRRASASRRRSKSARRSPSCISRARRDRRGRGRGRHGRPIRRHQPARAAGLGDHADQLRPHADAGRARCLRSPGTRPASCAPGGRAFSAPQVDEARLAVEREATPLGRHLEEVGREWRWTAPATAIGIRIESTHADFEPLDDAGRPAGRSPARQRHDGRRRAARARTVEPRFRVARSALQSRRWPTSTGRGVCRSCPSGRWSSSTARTTPPRPKSCARRIDSALSRSSGCILVLGLSEGKDALGVLERAAPRAARGLSDALAATSGRPRPRTSSRSCARPRRGATCRRMPICRRRSRPPWPRPRPDDLVLVTGSLFLVGEALVWWRRSPR